MLSRAVRFPVETIIGYTLASSVTMMSMTTVPGVLASVADGSEPPAEERPALLDRARTERARRGEGP
jgi:hypothetical protein